LVRDSNDIPHIVAQNDHDATFMLGYVHAQDRFFQMDFFRHQFSGTLSELVGRQALTANPSDIQLRVLGLRRAAEESMSTYSLETMSLLQAYADGVNAWVFDDNNKLPPEYNALELTKASMARWSVVDTLVMGKGLAFQLSFTLPDELELATDLAAYQQALGVDAGTKLFFQDMFRNAPFDRTITVPGFLPSKTAASASQRRTMMEESSKNLLNIVQPETLKLAKEYLDSIRGPSPFPNILDHRESPNGSNEWVISGSNTQSGYPILANDPHLGLLTAAIFYEAHLIVTNDPQFGPMNVNGASFAGTPVIVVGCNGRICWGATVNPLDVTDVYQERLIPNVAQMTLTHSVFETTREPLVRIPETYQVNTVGDGTMDNLVDSGITPANVGGTAFVVPRRNNGPIIAVDQSNPLRIVGLSVQYSGWRATQELETFRRFARASNVDQFKAAIQYFDFGSQNWAYADVDGNIGYFTSAEMPLREDLQTLGRVDGLPPFLIRDGTHQFKNEWLPVQTPQPGQALNYEILPYAEMPQVVNPPQGFIANANNDPVGTSLDNDPLNQTRRGGGVYYLSPFYDSGFRVGRIARLIQGGLANGGKLSVADMMRFQANNQMLDAEVLTPYLIMAFQNARANGATPELMALANDPRVVEAIGRLQNWDFSSPTGIREGYDPGDNPDNLSDPSPTEVQNSVAATIYSLWRAQMIKNTIDATLTGMGLANYLPGSSASMSALRNLLDSFPTMHGRGASGVNFFAVGGVPTPEAARDTIILRSLQEAIGLPASDTFAIAYGGSTNQNDYRFGRLHRIVFAHPLGSLFSIPTAAGFTNLATGLRGLSRAGGFEVVDASSHSARPRASAGQVMGVNFFMFGGGPARRFVGELNPAGINAFEIIPGGQSGVLGSSFYANMLGRWLTDHYHPMLFMRSQVESDIMTDQIFTP
jgi:penicillin amidase